VAGWSFSSSNLTNDPMGKILFLSETTEQFDSKRGWNVP
jgi:hypothetical protein